MSRWVVALKFNYKLYVHFTIVNYSSTVVHLSRDISSHYDSRVINYGHGGFIRFTMAQLR